MDTQEAEVKEPATETFSARLSPSEKERLEVLRQRYGLRSQNEVIRVLITGEIVPWDAKHYQQEAA